MSDLITWELKDWIGLSTSPNTSSKDPHYVEDCQNVDFDERRLIIKRRGSQPIFTQLGYSGGTGSTTGSIAESKILIVPQHYGTDDFDETNGIVALIYDTGTAIWSWVGDSYVGGDSGGWSVSASVSTARLQPEFSMFYTDWVVDNNRIEILRLYVWDSLGRHEYDLWTFDAGTNEFYAEASVRDTADAYGDLIACLAGFTKLGGIDRCCWAVKTSTDRGVNWGAVYYLPDAGETVAGIVRIDENGVIWVCYGDHINEAIYLYKSTNQGSSFSLVSTISYTNISPPWIYYIGTLKFTVNSTGQYQYIAVILFEPEGDPEYIDLVYSSNDYGVSWTKHDVGLGPEGAADQKPIHASNGLYYNCAYIPIADSLFRLRHSNNAVSSTIDQTPVTPYPSQAYYIDIQGDHAQAALVESEIDFGSITGATHHNILHSADSGVSWAVIDSPIPTNSSADKSMTVDGHSYDVAWTNGSVDVMEV